MTAIADNVRVAGNAATIDAAPGKKPVKYQALNEQIHQLVNQGIKSITIENVTGQRFIAAALKGKDIDITIHGTPGNDLGIFMDGPRIEVFGNVEDQAGNTMNDGSIVIHGSARDVAGLSARGGTMLVRGDGGYRVGVHVKEFHAKRPVMVFGGRVRDFFGEYMAGGLLVVLGLDIKDNGVFSKITTFPVTGASLATGIHGGKVIVARAAGEVPAESLGKGAKVAELDEADLKDLLPVLRSFCSAFGTSFDAISALAFSKVVPVSKRPFASNYCAKCL